MKLKLIVFSLVLLSSCSESEYKDMGEGVSKKLIRFGEESTSIKDGQFLELNYSLKPLFSSEKLVSNNVLLSDYDKDIFGSKSVLESILNCRKDDSLQLRLTYKNIKNKVLDEYSRLAVQMDDSVTIELNLGVSLCMTAAEYLDYRTKQVREGLIKEMELIDDFIDENDLGPKLTRKGDLYFMKIKETSESEVNTGDDISISYKCMFLNGEQFDLVTTEEPLYINLGTPDQVVVGMESILKEMNVGETSMVIIPSYLAFGEQGSSDGRVPSKTPIVIEVTIIEKYI